MTRWLLWSAVLILTNGSGTLASRARNTPSIGYHALAALLSHGTFFVSNLIGIDVLVEVIKNHDARLACMGFVVYAGASTSGSIVSHWVAMRFLEKGNRRVGGIA